MTRHELLSFLDGFHQAYEGWPDRPMLVQSVKANRRFFGSTWHAQLHQTLAGCMRVGYVAEIGCEECHLKRLELTEAGREALADMNERGCAAHWLNPIHGRANCQTDYDYSA